MSLEGRLIVKWALENAKMFFDDDQEISHVKERIILRKIRLSTN